MKIHSNTINRYDNMIYNSRPVKFSEFISDKYNKVHVELFNDALNKFFIDIIDTNIDQTFISYFKDLYNEAEYINLNSFLELFNSKDKQVEEDNNDERSQYILNNLIKNLSIDSEKYISYIFNIFKEKETDNVEDSIFKTYALKLYKENHRIIELKNNEYWKPSSILIMSNIKPYKKYVCSLDKYWNNIQSMKNYNVEDIKLTNYVINDVEIKNINYVNGKARLVSKLSDIEFDVPFNYLDENMNINEDMLLL